MIAKIWLLLPYQFLVAMEATFPPIAYEVGSYRFTLIGLVSRGQLSAPPGMALTGKGEAAYFADVLHAQVSKTTFNRQRDHSASDPPISALLSACNYFLLRIRRLLNASGIRPVNEEDMRVQIDYCDDKGQLLVPDEKSYSRFGTQRATWIVLPLSAPTVDVLGRWTSLDDLPPWMELLLDAKSSTAIGPAVVLGAVALEVFSSSITEQLQEIKGIFSAGFWKWLSERDNDFMKAPNVEELFDMVLLQLCGHSLKEEKRLWKSMVDLKTARNKFVHEGVARIGKEPVTLGRAVQLLSDAEAICNLIREWLPPELRWTRFEKSTVAAELSSAPTGGPFFMHQNT